MSELKQIGHYVLGDTLGQGSFGKVKSLCAIRHVRGAIFHQRNLISASRDKRSRGNRIPTWLFNLYRDCYFLLHTRCSTPDAN